MAHVYIHALEERDAIQTLEWSGVDGVALVFGRLTEIRIGLDHERELLAQLLGRAKASCRSGMADQPFVRPPADDPAIASRPAGKDAGGRRPSAKVVSIPTQAERERLRPRRPGRE